MRAEVPTFIKFAIVGVANTLIDLAVYNASFFLGASIYFATTLGFAAGVTNSYLLNRSWTFRSHGSQASWRQYGWFVAIAIVGLVINYLMIYLLVPVLPIENQTLKANIIRLLAIAVVMLWNYSLNRFVLFKQTR